MKGGVHSVRLLICVFIVGFSSNAFSQGTNPQCPTLELNFPKLLNSIETEVTLVAQAVGNIEHDKIVYGWIVSSGEIVAGQGTPIATFVAGEDDAGKDINITVKLKGVPTGCSVEATGQVSIASLIIGEPCDSLEDVRPSKAAINWFRGRIDNYMACIPESPGYEGFITVELPETYTRVKKITFIKRMHDQFVFRKYDLTRVTFAVSKCDCKIARATLWVLPPNAKVPKYARNYQMINAENFSRSEKTLFLPRSN